MSRIARHIVFALFFLCIAGSAGAAELTVNKIAAVVNGEMITLHELRTHTIAELARRGLAQDDPRAPVVMQSILDAMISDILIRQEAARYKITVSDSEVDSELNKLLKDRRMSQAAFDEQLVKQGSSLKMYKENIRDSLLRQRMLMLMIARKVVVTDEEVAKYYEEHKENFTGQKAADFSVIVFQPSVKADAIYKQLSSGTLSFEEAAQKYSIDSSAKNGGRIGSISMKRLPANFRNLLSSLTEGQMSPLIKIEGNQGVVRLNKISEGAPQTLEEAASQITEMLRETRTQERFTEYTQQLRGKAVVDIRL